MHEVLARVPWTVAEYLAARGQLTDELFDGLSFSRRDLSEPRRRVPWDEFACFLDRAAEVLGSPVAFESLGAEAIKGFEYYRWLAALFVDPAKLYEFGCTKLPLVLYGPALRCWCRVERPGFLRTGYEVVGERRGSMPFAHASLATMQTISCHLGLPPATVQAKLGPKRADFLIALPASTTVPARLRGKRDAIVEHLVEQLFADHVSDLHAAVDEYLALGPQHRAGADLLAVRAQDRAFAASQTTTLDDFREQVRHLVEDELGLRLVGLWTATDSPPSIPATPHDGAVRWQLPLVVGRHEVGRLVLSCDDDREPDRSIGILRDVLPVLAVGLENARRQEQAGAEHAALKQQLRRWQEANLSSNLALDAMDGQAFVLTSTGDVISTNAQGKAALEQEGEPLRAQLRRAAAGHPTDLEISPLGPPELAQGRMLALRRDVAASLRTRVDRAKRCWKLTRRQTDVLGHVVEGRSNKEIAAMLGCAEGTVEIHLTQLLRRASADSRGTLTAKFWMKV